MAGTRKKEAERIEARLSVQQMKDAIAKIDRRIEELDHFEVSSVSRYGDPKVQAIEDKLDNMLVSIFGSDSIQYERYRRGIPHIMPMTFWPDMSLDEVQGGVRQGIESSRTQLEGIKSMFIEEIENQPSDIPVAADQPKIAGSDVFVVHGHDETMKNQVARLIENLKLKPIILHEQSNKGRTLIEKFEDHSRQAGFAVILLTPDDLGGSANTDKPQQKRARQNVILEQGYFLGKLGRSRVCAVYVDGVELPSDLSGVLYVKYDTNGAWKYQIAKEMKDAGLDIDLNLIN